MQKKTLFQRILLTSALSLSCLSLLAGCLSQVPDKRKTIIPEATIEETESEISPLDDKPPSEVKRD